MASSKQAKDTRTGKRPAKRFPIVGIGASAGGLAALEEFFRHVPEHSGMAFIVVQHLGASGASALTDLLQPVTSMRVRVATDGLRVRSDVVYIAPPDQQLVLEEGTLRLRTPLVPRARNLPIDVFLTSLAWDAEQQAIGVILSGMGFDGTLGFWTIRARGGRTYVQSLESAASISMPCSALAAGLVDGVATAAELPLRICADARDEAGRVTRRTVVDGESAAQPSVAKRWTFPPPPALERRGMGAPVQRSLGSAAPTLHG